MGPSLRGKLAKLGIGTIRDLLEYAPRDYLRPLGETQIAGLRPETEAGIAGTIRSASLRKLRGRNSVFKAIIEDDTDSVTAVWFNQPWLEERLTPGTHVRLRGRLRRREFNVKSYDIGSASATADFAPMYPATEDVTQKRLRDLVERAHATWSIHSRRR